MEHKELARKLREALFDHIEAGRRDALQDGAIDGLFERVLASCEIPTYVAGDFIRFGPRTMDVTSDDAPCAMWTAPASLPASAPSCQRSACVRDQVSHASDCAVHNGTALAEGPCDCKPDTTNCGVCMLHDIANRPLDVSPNASASELLAARKAEWERISLEAFRSYQWPMTPRSS